MSTNKIIVHNGSGIPDSEVLALIGKVIDEGRVSDEGRSYCYVTIFTHPKHGRISVSTKTRRLRDGAPSDSFYVWNE